MGGRVCWKERLEKKSTSCLGDLEYVQSVPSLAANNNQKQVGLGGFLDFCAEQR